MRFFYVFFPAIFILFSYSSAANAQYYGWHYQGTYYSSADAACRAHMERNIAIGNSSVKSYRLQFNSTGQTADCILLSSLGGSLGSTTLARSGDSCENPDATYNPQTGRCDDPPPPSNCAPKAGQNTTWTMQRPDLNGLGNIEYGCEAGCRISLGTSSCQPSSEGATTGVCYGVGTFTGAECQVGDNPTGGNPPTDPDPTDPPPICGDDHVWSGTACVPKPPEKCDPSTGEVCPPDDGDGDGDGDDDGDGDGKDGDGDGDGDGKGDGDGNGEGDGECDPKTDPNQCKGSESGGDCDPKTDPNQCKGKDDCDPKTDPNKCIKPSVEGEACDTELKCEGDVIQCAILRANKNQICQWKYDNKVRSDIASELAGKDYQLEEKSVAVSSLFTEAVNKGRWLPQSCPSPESFTVMGRSYSFSWEPACRFAQAIGPLIVALASIFFAVSIGRGIKGS
ncbi:virulence factor TspB C-terminal domain-related protein [Pseudomonas sp. NY15366]